MIDTSNTQVLWERGSIERGVRRYRESLFRTKKDGGREMKELAELEPGLDIMREVILNAEEAIKAAQVEAMESIRDKTRGRWEMWWWPLCCLDADKIALIGARAILGSSRETGHSRPIRSVALEVGRHMKLEREFETWCDTQNKAESATRKAKKDGDLEYDVYVPNWWKLMRQRAPEISERAFRKWARKSGQYDRLDWGRDVRLGVGTKVLDLLVQHGGGWFSIDLVAQHAKHRYTTERRVFLTERAESWVKGQHRGHELNRPWLLPMLVEPLDWKRKEKRDAEVRVDRAPHDVGAGCSNGGAGGGSA